MRVSFAAKSTDPVVVSIDRSAEFYYGAGAAVFTGLSFLGFALYNIKKQKKVEDQEDEFETLI